MITQALASERVKIFSTRSPYWCLGIVAALGLGLAVIFGLVLKSATSTTGPDGTQRVGGSVFSSGVTEFGIIVLMIMAILSITSEFRFGTIRTTLQAIPQREVVLVAKAVVYGGIAAVFAGVLNVIALAIGKALAGNNIDIDLASADSIRSYWGVPLYAFLCVVVGIGIGAIVRQTAGAIVITLVWMLVLENVLRSVPRVRGAVGPWLPFTNASRFLSDTASNSTVADSGGFSYHWGPYGSIVYFAAFAVVIFVVGVVSLKKRDA